MLLSALLLCAGAAAENYPYRSDYLWVTVPDHADWLYEKGEKACVEVQFYKYGIPRDAVVEYEIADDMMPADDKGTVELKGGRASINVGTRPTPGFRDIRLTTEVDGRKYAHHVKIGFSVDEIRPCVKEPADFADFWRGNIEEMRRTPLTYSKEKAEEYCTDKVDCYLVKVSLNRQRQSVYAYLFYPKDAAKGSCPVVLCPPGAGIKTIKEPLRHKYYAENGCIRMEMEIHGLDPRLPKETFDDISRAFNGKENGYLGNGIDDRDRYYMKRVYLACIRSIDLLTSLPEWDGKMHRQPSGARRHGRLCRRPHRRLPPLQQDKRHADRKEHQHTGLLRRGELRAARESLHIHDVGLQRRHLSAHHELRRVEHAGMPQGGARHPDKRTLDIGHHRIRPDGVDEKTPGITFKRGAGRPSAVPLRV